MFDNLKRSIVSVHVLTTEKVKAKSSMARSLPVENLLAQNVGSIINYLQQFTEVAQWGATSCSQLQPATDNGVRDGRSNWLVAPPRYTGQCPLSSTYCTLQCGLGCKSQDLLHWESLDRATFGMTDQYTACAATQNITHVSLKLTQVLRDINRL